MNSCKLWHRRLAAGIEARKAVQPGTNRSPRQSWQLGPVPSASANQRAASSVFSTRGGDETLWCGGQPYKRLLPTPESPSTNSQAALPFAPIRLLDPLASGHRTPGAVVEDPYTSDILLCAQRW